MTTMEFSNLPSINVSSLKMALMIMRLSSLVTTLSSLVVTAKTTTTTTTTTTGTEFQNMNGEYILSQTPGAPPNKSFSTNFDDYPGGVEFFEVYHGPITSVYSEVFWKSFSNPLPDDIIKRFNNKGMAIVGLEIDQVFKSQTTSDDDTVDDVSVPITCAYNHHHDTAIVGKGATMKKFKKTDPFFAKNNHTTTTTNNDGRNRDYLHLDMDQVWIPIETSKVTTTGLPTSAMFSDGNGGEYRKTFHAYAPPFAQIVESPSQIAGAAMQIDTWNRDEMNCFDGGSSPFVPGPYPQNNLAPLTGPDAIYSGLLECPLTTRIQKIYDRGSEDFDDSYDLNIAKTQCIDGDDDYSKVRSSENCFVAARQILFDIGAAANTTNISNKTVDSGTIPPGCSIMKATTSMQLLHLQQRQRLGTTTSAARKSNSYVILFNEESTSVAPCGGSNSSDASIIHGTIKSSLNVSTTLTVSGPNSSVTIIMEGPEDNWFGIGFNASLMADLPYAIIVDGQGNIEERRLGNHGSGKILSPPSITVVSNTVTRNGKRRVVLQRPIQHHSRDGEDDYYKFSTTDLSIPLIHAVGSGPTLSYHRASAAIMLNLWPIHYEETTTSSSPPVCVCAKPATPFGQGSGMLKYIETGQTIGFPPNRCSPEPREVLLSQKNPTCDIRTYVGGLSACHHGWKLLDANQDIPWTNRPLEYYKKFRIYFQEYNASFHKQIIRRDWGIAADGDRAEYDVPPCPSGTPVEECTHTITGTWIPVQPSEKDMYLVKVHFHCHAPTCLRMEMWNNDTGTLICDTEPVYGGTSKIDQDRFDEPGYVAIPPCLWGSPDHGLESPPLITGVSIHVIAVTNNTYPHHGEMALPEISLVKGPL